MTQDTWNEFAAEWDTRADTRLYSEQAFASWERKAAPLVSDLANSRVLDFGCGTGLLSEKLAPICGHIVAVDTAAAMIDVLQAKVMDKHIGNITPLVAAIDAETIRENSEFSEKFDLIVASSVCGFLPDYNLTLRDLSSALNLGGLFVQWDWLNEMPIERIRNAYKASGLIDLGVEEVFAMTMDNESVPVVMGVARLRV
jgi:2-polyprenyl-3-methyl-5-hydroxy-6-metoxy-1,4-benzoquinol methylase